MVDILDILKALDIRFEAKDHKYFRQDKEVPSVNNIINTVLGNPFAKDTIYMRQSRDKGTLLHTIIGDLVSLGKKPDFLFPEIENFLRITKEKNIVWNWSEQIVFGRIDGMEYAGTLDLFSILSEEISDIKTGSTKQLKKWQMQLSMYAQAIRDLCGLQVSKGSILWLHGEESEYIPVTLLSKAEISQFLKRYYYPEQNTPTEEISLKCLNPNAIQELNETLTAIEIMEEKIKGIKEQILKEMEERQINQIKLGKRVISYIAPTTRESVDSKKLKNEYPEIWAKCRKESKINSSIRIK